MVTTVAARLGWKREKVISRLHHYKTAQALSLDAPTGRGDSATAMGDLISCPKSEVSRLHGDLEDVLLRDELRAVLGTSTTNGHSRGGRNSVIMRLHYGLEDGVEYTCAQIADMFKMSVSRVYTVIQHELCMLRRLYESGKYSRPDEH
jgi:DNA-directed RNA polymerase sigma subunit (sigma70/sigma32)